MIAAMAAAVSTASTLRLLSSRTDLSSKSVLEGVGLLGAGPGAGAAENGPPKATGFTVGAVATVTGGLVAGAPVWPTE